MHVLSDDEEEVEMMWGGKRRQKYDEIVPSRITARDRANYHAPLGLVSEEALQEPNPRKKERLILHAGVREMKAWEVRDHAQYP